MKSSTPILKDLVLIGGGHSHAIVLKKFGMNPIAGVRLTLITDVSHTPYSGMLPGYVAGLYNFDECHIDLRPLTQFSQARMILDRAMGLDLEKNQVICENHPPISFDILSIDIGSKPATLSIPGATEHSIPVKPISKFIDYWNTVKNSIIQNPNQKMRIAVVGGGAGGVELIFSIQGCLSQIYSSTNSSANKLELHLFQRGAELLPERSQWVGQKVEQILRNRGVKLHLQQTVNAVKAEGEEKIISCESGLEVKCDRLFWVTQASASPWLKQAGLLTDKQGFIQVDDTLRSLSHPHVFAAGDVATMVNHPRPKAGVFAVRQGQPLFENLRRALLEKTLKPFTPQKQFLILIGTGNEKAIASRGIIGLGPYSFLWRWKDQIDRKFMDQFTNLEPMSYQPHQPEKIQVKSPKMRCSGCGSKVGSSVLKNVLNRIKSEIREDVLIGLKEAEDAAVIQVPTEQVIVQTVDYFPAILDDPFIFGKITTHHCLNDLFAMGATPQSALAIVTLPYATSTKQEETLFHLLSGVNKVLNTVSASLIGGHTTEGEKLALGLTCNGFAIPNKLLRKGEIKPNQALILTKAIGTGTLFAADMQLKAKGRWIEAAIASMLLSNQAAADCFKQYKITACTDITGFGLIGHLLEMIRTSSVAVELNLEAISILKGAKETTHKGIFSSLYPENYQFSKKIKNQQQASQHPLYPLLFDPQTSGGLLASIPLEHANSCLNHLKRLGYVDSCIIGQVQPQSPGILPITIQL
ncbi:selenide, water dikinase [Lyngbya aestuarii BL J]|uniref:Selenide, water dikinase n=1 Tax=Lyngbya aestuarii BL J TaxID=1348334 RepID=U7QC52_9CYAN|nr:selenide, water dikinase SelD [Lyngbya aestuarii]ERT04605.1 selenide, water dikinase [Lyngbya aestuarii BL J]